MSNRKDRHTEIEYREKSYSVRTWWDQWSKNWISYVQDENEVQIGDAQYAANRPDDLHKLTLAIAESIIDEELYCHERYEEQFTRSIVRKGES